VKFNQDRIKTLDDIRFRSLVGSYSWRALTNLTGWEPTSGSDSVAKPKLGLKSDVSSDPRHVAIKVSETRVAIWSSQLGSALAQRQEL
jgi:hypothetical protein